MHKPLYAVIGTTGVGKSELAVKLAKRLQGNVINGDSMQVYKGLDIITNKPNQMELSSAPHYLFDFLDPINEYSVSEYVRDALEVIEHSHTTDNPPIIVGGTNYYIQALLWNKSIIQTASVPGLSNKASVKDSCHKSIDPELADTLCYLLENSDPRFNSAESIREFCECAPFHQTLMRIDPKMAKRWHPKDIRKLRRSLEVYYTTGNLHSDWYNSNDYELRYPTCVFWLYGKPDELYPRLDARVDNMIKNGMFEEMEAMLRKMENGRVVGLDSDYTRGILQAIGFKEFQKYFECKTDANSKAEQLDKLLKCGIQDMKIATRQYAKRQITWIKNKFAPIILKEHSRNNGALYLIDASNPDAITNDLIERIYQVAVDFAKGLPNQDPATFATDELVLQLLNQKVSENLWEQYTCDVCIYRSTGENKVLNGYAEYQNHLNSNSHKSMVRRLKRKKENQEWFHDQKSKT